MGRFTYDGARIELDDRVLAHIQVVMTTKLRRGEPFFFSWSEDLSTGGGRTSVWIHAHATLVFSFYGGRRPTLNRTWLDDLMSTANSPSGLRIVPERPDLPSEPERDG